MLNCEDYQSPTGDIVKQRQSNESLIGGLIDYIQRNGLEITYANFQGYKKPFVINRHSPDVVAQNRSTRLVYLGIVKLCASLEDQITKEEFEDFSKRVMKNSDAKNVRIPLVIAVPNACESKVKESFRQFEIPWKENIYVIGI